MHNPQRDEGSFLQAVRALHSWGNAWMTFLGYENQFYLKTFGLRNSVTVSLPSTRTMELSFTCHYQLVSNQCQQFLPTHENLSSQHFGPISITFLSFSNWRPWIKGQSQQEINQSPLHCNQDAHPMIQQHRLVLLRWQPNTWITERTVDQAFHVDNVPGIGPSQHVALLNLTWTSTLMQRSV